MTLSMKEASERVDVAIKVLLDECNEHKARTISSEISKTFRESDARIADVVLALVSQLAALTIGDSEDEMLVFTMMVSRLLTKAVTASHQTMH